MLMSIEDLNVNEYVVHLQIHDKDKWQSLQHLKEEEGEDRYNQLLHEGFEVWKQWYRDTESSSLKERKLRLKAKQGEFIEDEAKKIQEFTDEDSIFYINNECKYKQLKKVADRSFEQSRQINFLISKGDKIKGKLTAPLYNYKKKVTLARVGRRITDMGDVFKLFFIDDLFNPRRWLKERTIDEEFYIYHFISRDKEYLVYSQDALPIEEYTLHGTLIELEDSAVIGQQASIPMKLPIFFVYSAVSKIIRYNSHEEFIKKCNELELSHENFFNYLLSNGTHSFRHPKYFEELMGAFLFSSKIGYSQFPLHLFVLAKAGTGKTFMLELLQKKLQESQEVVEGSGSTIKSLVPSFKSTIPDPGAMIKSTRLCLVDEFLRILIRVKKEERFEQLSMMNPLLEHKKREFRSGNGSITAKMISKLFVVSNPIYNTKTLPLMAESLDPSFLSRLLIWYQDDYHIKFIQKKKGVQDTFFKMSDEDFISIFDYLQIFKSNWDSERLMKIFDKYRTFMPELVLDVYDARYDHHLECLLDGIIKLRCMFTGDVSFEAVDEDYDRVAALWQQMILNWNAGSDLREADYYTKDRYMTYQMNFILEKMRESDGKIRYSKFNSFDIEDVYYHLEGLFERKYLERRSNDHYVYWHPQYKIYKSNLALKKESGGKTLEN